jgi:hypothetical protein
MIADDSAGVLILAHELMRRAASRRGMVIGPFSYQPEVLAFANEQLRTIPNGSSRQFSEDHIRLWRAERLARMSPSRVS